MMGMITIFFAIMFPQGPSQPITPSLRFLMVRFLATILELLTVKLHNIFLALSIKYLTIGG